MHAAGNKAELGEGASVHALGWSAAAAAADVTLEVKTERVDPELKSVPRISIEPERSWTADADPSTAQQIPSDLAAGAGCGLVETTRDGECGARRGD